MAHKLPADIRNAPKAFAAFAARINALLALGRAVAAMKGGPGLKVDVAEGNILITIDPSAFDGAGAGEHPFQLYLVTVAGTPKVRVRYGDVNSIVPPEVQGGSGETDFDATAGHYYIDVTVDSNGTPTAAAVSKGASIPSNTATHGYRRIGEVQVDGSNVTLLQSVTGSLEVLKCGATTYSWGSVGGSIIE